MKLVVFFPGIGYHCDKPLLYYARKLAQEYGYEENIFLSYSYDGGNIRGDEKKMQQAFEVLYEQAEKQLANIDFGKYQEILFVSKSVGTIIASNYAWKHKILCRQIMYTPLRQTYEFPHKDAIAFIGTKDPWSDTEEVVYISGVQKIPIYVYEDTNHSIETADTMKNLEILTDVMAKTKKYMQSIIIRQEEEHEHRDVENMVRESFWNVYQPGCLEHYVLHKLRNDPAFIPELDLVMTLDGKLIGQNMFMRSEIHSEDGSSIPVLTMGPICITPKLKRQGYGKILLDESLEKAKELGFGAVCLEGNIEFYGKSGFKQASEFGIRYQGMEAGEDASYFLCKELIPGYLDDVTGEYGAPKGYYVDEKEVEGFDKTFPSKKKEKLPGQIFGDC